MASRLLIGIAFGVLCVLVCATGCRKATPRQSEDDKPSAGKAARSQPAVALFPIYVLVGHEGEFKGIPVYKCGYIDRLGTVVVQPQYTYAGAFSDGLALVDWGKRKWAFIDANGRVAFSVEHDFVSWFREGLAAVLDMKTENDPNSYRAGFINLSGQIAVPMTLRAAGAFSEGLAEVHPVGKDADKFGYIDKSGKLVIEPRFKMASPFSEGLAAVREPLPDGRIKSGYIDKIGQYVITVKTGRKIALMRSFKEGIALVADAALVRYIDKDGNDGIPRRFDFGGSFYDGLAWVRLPKAKGGKCGYIDKSGELVIKPQFDDARPFSEGLAGVRVVDKWGFINRTGKIIIKPQFTKVGLFTNGLAIVEWGNPKRADTATTAYIDKTGRVVWKTANRVPFGFFRSPDELW